ncbi:MAG: hypothetical protein IMZ62_01230 [Chloroflexi bacterium]|nr:hypothetical protein [Chloroflexota bacterium]
MALNFAPSGGQGQDTDNLYPDHYEHYKAEGGYPVNGDGVLLDFDPTLDGPDALHGKIANMVVNFARESGEKMSVRHPSWRKIDETQTAYIATDEKEDAEQLKDSRKPVHIVMPMSKACLETQVTYDCAAALEDPIFGYIGTGPEDRFGAMMCEIEIQRQSVVNKFVLNLMTMFRDARKYGFGVIHPQWRRKMGQEVIDVPRPKYLGIIPYGTARRVVSERIVTEGNRLFNIDPYRFWPDPKVSISEIQDAEFLCWGRHTDRNALLSMERSGGYGYFNCEYLRKEGAMRSALMTEYSSGRNTKSGFDNTSGTTETNPVDVITMFVRLIPFDLKLGSSRYPEVWCFEVAGDKLVIKAEPMNFRHGMYPISVAAPSYDGYSITPTSDQETIYGMQMVADFFINQFIRDQKKSGNDMLAADPSRWMLATLEDPEPGRVVLLDEQYWGVPGAVEEGLRQLDFHNSSLNNPQAVAFLFDFMKQVSGANDNVQGVSHARSEAITAAEATGARQSSLSRLQKDVRVMDVMGMTDLAIMLAANTQQFMSLEHYIQVVGRNAEQLMGEFGMYMPEYPYVLLNRDVLNVHLDIMPRNGTIPGGANLGALQAWFTTMMSNALSAPTIDVIRYGKRFAREAGIQGGVDDLFVLTPQQRLLNAMMQNGVKTSVQPDEKVEKQAQAGNLVPVDATTGVF